MRIFVLSTCDTCRKALKELRAAGHAPEVIDIRKDGIGPGDLAAMLDAFGDRAVNRASATWRGLDEGQRARPAAELIAGSPTLLKRPVIERDGAWLQGWSAATRAALL
ncbi:arsenate reductase family protein [Wenxinia saemankumensis]|uniref:Arsenate reductase, glutaredoxin family n=1 Tax=Wenxinia saemankumensis TaxID=1447782 RepID=A0A1M6CER2_9RHOB|nr:ArsC/Spx/MgsR family protein [Wenxinia saemankumensis]SHI59509.1 Arsenate reductase, glutaredoxin family [Wenxinia saemankumensis]